MTAETPTVYCQYNDVGRVGWVESLTVNHPAGDCDGPIGRIVHPSGLTAISALRHPGAVMHLCERHYLQARQLGVPFALALSQSPGRDE